MDIACVSEDGTMPLHTLLVAGPGALESPQDFARFSIETFLQKEEDLSKQTESGYNALHFLFSELDPTYSLVIWQAIVSDSRFLPSRVKAMLAVDGEMRSPLHLALKRFVSLLDTSSCSDEAISSHVKLIEKVCSLEEATQPCLAVKDRDGCTPLLCLSKVFQSCNFGQHYYGILSTQLPKLFRALIESDDTQSCLHRQDNCGSTVAHGISSCNSNFPFKEVMEVLLRHPIDLTVRDQSGYTALDIAARSSAENVQLLQILMERSSSSALEEPVDNEGSVLHQICTRRKPGIEDLLTSYLSQIASSRTTNGQGRTALMMTVGIIFSAGIASKLAELAGDGIDVCDNDGKNLLYLACEAGCEVMVEALIRHGAKVDDLIGPKGQEQPPLLIAAEEGKLDLVRMLLRLGADPYLKSFAGWQLHHFAAECNRAGLQGIVDTLDGFDYDERIAAVAYSDGCDATIVVENPTILHVAAADSSTQSLRWLLNEKGVRSVDREAKLEITPLMIAAGTGCLENCKVLIKAGASLSKARTDGWGPFHAACEEGHIHVCEYLLSVDKAIASKLSNSRSPLEISAAKGHLKVVRLLLRCDVDIPDSVEEEALRAGRSDIADLIRRKARENKRRDTIAHMRSETELNTLRVPHVCQQGTENDFLDLIKAGIRSNARVNDEYETPLHLASRFGWTEATKALVTAGAEIDSVSGIGEIPVLCATQAEQWECAMTLHRLGGRLDLRDHVRGLDVLIDAAAANNSEMLAYFFENGVDPVVSSTFDGDTPLMYTNDPSCVNLLLQYGCDPFATSKRNHSAIHQLSHQKLTGGECLRKILANGPAKRAFELLDMRSLEGGGTSLYIASFCGRSENIRILIDHGADVNQPGGPFGTPFQAAFKLQLFEVQRILTENGARPCMAIRGRQEHAA